MEPAAVALWNLVLTLGAALVAFCMAYAMVYVVLLWLRPTRYEDERLNE